MSDVALPERRLRTLHLFAGGGGGILADMLLGHVPVCAVELDAYCRSILLARQQDGMLPRFPIWDDVRTFDGEPWRGHVDVVAGGFPCQDISNAGKRAGISGPRSGLWTEFARILGEIRPRYAFIENTAALALRGLNVVLSDLAALGMDARWCCLGADDVGAPHIRKRLWILAFPTGIRRNGDTAQPGSVGAGEDEGRLCKSARGCTDVENPHSRGLSQAYLCQEQSGRTKTVSSSETVPNPAQLPQRESTNQAVPVTTSWHAWQESWCGNWWGTEPSVGRVVNELAHRMDRLKTLGNGQVPLCAATAWRILTAQPAEEA